MCNLYRLNKPAADIAHLFGVEATQGANYSEEVYPGYPGLVMAGRRLKVMNWGFPLVMTGRNGQKLKPKPVTNARDDKLSTAFWRASFESRRCLIPVSAWAEPEGETGQMTRTWYSLPEGAFRGGRPVARHRGMGRCLHHGHGRKFAPDARGPRPDAGDLAAGSLEDVD
jgi:putative SOS response-associated peptidase YedK